MKLDLNYAGPLWARPGQDTLEQMRRFMEQGYNDNGDDQDAVLEISVATCLSQGHDSRHVFAYQVEDVTDPCSGGTAMWLVPGPEGKCAMDESLMEVLRIAVEEAEMRPEWVL